MLSEINRVLRRGGTLVLSTPNIASRTALYRLLGGKHPQGWSVYGGKDGDRHNREYTPSEVERLLDEAGFERAAIETFSLAVVPLKLRVILWWIAIPWLIRGQGRVLEKRGEFIRAIARKRGPVSNRRPGWLYWEPD
jgi:hypothetical protein